MEDSLEGNLTTRSLLKGILATEPVRAEVKQQSKKRLSRRASSSYIPQDENPSSPSMNLRSRMKDGVRRSLRKSALEASTLKRNLEIKSKPKSAKKGSHPILEDLDKITPRTLLKKIIQNEDEVSIIVSQRSKSAIDDDRRQDNTPTAKLSSVGNINLSLPDLQDTENITLFNKSRKKRKLRVSEFEREVDERLPKNKDRYNHSHDRSDVPSLFTNSYSISGSIENKLDISTAPESTFKRGLLRKPNKICLVSLGDFEQGVEDKYQQLKGSQECFIEPAEEDSLSNEVAELDTELYAQSLGKEGIASKSDRRHRGASKLFVSTYDAIKEANNELLETDARNASGHPTSNAQSTEEIGGDLGDNRNAREANKDHEVADSESVESRFDDADGDVEADDDSVPEDDAHSEAEAAGDAGSEAEAAGDAGSEAEAAGDAGSEAEAAGDAGSEAEAAGDVLVKSNIQLNKSSLKRNRKSDISEYFQTLRQTRLREENDMQPAESVHVHTVSVSNPDGSSESTEESSDEENMALTQSAIDRGIAKKKEKNQLMLSALPETPAFIKSARIVRADKPAVNKKTQRTKSTKPKKPASVFTSSQVKQIFSHHAHVRVAKEAMTDVEKCLDRYMDQLAVDLSTYTAHANRKTITRADMELLMKRQRLVTDTTSLNVLIEKHLPLECRTLLIPCAMSGNKVFPKM